jgi:antitoxin VapB
MSINVKNAEAERLLAELKERTGRGTTDLLLDLLRREKERLERELEDRVARAIADTNALRERWLARPLVDPRSADEILSYDENGLPL